MELKEIIIGNGCYLGVLLSIVFIIWHGRHKGFSAVEIIVWSVAVFAVSFSAHPYLWIALILLMYLIAHLRNKKSNQNKPINDSRVENLDKKPTHYKELWLFLIPVGSVTIISWMLDSATPSTMGFEILLPTFTIWLIAIVALPLFLIAFTADNTKRKLTLYAIAIIITLLFSSVSILSLLQYAAEIKG